MTNPRVIGVRSVELGVPNLAKSMQFYRDVWGLTEVSAEAGVVYLRGTGLEHHVLALREQPEARLMAVHMAAPDRANVSEVGDGVARQVVFALLEWLAVRAGRVQRARQQLHTWAADGGCQLAYGLRFGQQRRASVRGRALDVADVVDAQNRHAIQRGHGLVDLEALRQVAPQLVADDEDAVVTRLARETHVH